MRMDKSHSSDTQSEGGKETTVLSIECVAGSFKADEWNFDMLQTGDIVEEITIGGSPTAKAPFKHGRAGVQKMLHSAFKLRDTSISVRVHRGKDEFLELHACIVPLEPAGKMQYVLRSIHDPNYAVTFVDRTESECADLQGSRSSRVACALSKAQLQDGFVSYPWLKKMRESLPIQSSSSFFSLLIFPKAADPSASCYNCLEDTLARANAWLNSAQASGVRIVFMNVQSEALLTKISGETASSTVNAVSLSDLSNLASASIYGFEDYHGVDIGVVRGVRLWYTQLAGEYTVEIKLQEGDSRLGFAVSRTEEGFICVVCGGSRRQRSALHTVGAQGPVQGSHKSLQATSDLQSRQREGSPVDGLPYRSCPMHATTRSASARSLPCTATPCSRSCCMFSRGTRGLSPREADLTGPPVAPAPPSPPHPPAAADESWRDLAPPAEQVKNLSLGRMLVRDTAGEVSLRFHNFSLSNNWV